MKCYIWSVALHVLERYGEDQLDRSYDNAQVLRRVKKKGISYTKQKRRKDRRGEKRRKKAQAVTGWPKEKLLELERGSTISHSVDKPTLKEAADLSQDRLRNG
jgi:hypothetical protein